MTPTDHARQLYAAASAPKKLVIQRNTTPYVASAQYASEVIPMMVEWLRSRVLPDDDIEIREKSSQEETVHYIGGAAPAPGPRA